MVGARVKANLAIHQMLIRPSGVGALTNLSNAALTNALRCRRTVSVCVVFKRAKLGRFAYFELKFALKVLLPR